MTSFIARFTEFMVMLSSSISLYAVSLLTTPSSCLTLEVMFSAMKDSTSGVSCIPSCIALLRIIATLVSTSGGCTSAMSPPSRRVRNLSSRMLMSIGGRSAVITIWPPILYMALKMLKNSSWVLLLPAIYWISSIRKSPTLRYSFLTSSMVPFLIAEMTRFVNSSPHT